MAAILSRHYGGENVPGGIYFSRKDLEFITVPAEGGRLEGRRADLYVKTPAPLMLIAGPIMGLVFAFFLPLSGILVLVPYLADRFRNALTPATARMATAQVTPGVSYLESKAPSGKASAMEEAGDSKLISMAEEIAARRSRESGSNGGAR